MDAEFGICEVCDKKSSLERTYYKYDIKCDCCNSKEDNHFEYVSHCSTCVPRAPSKIIVHMQAL